MHLFWDTKGHNCSPCLYIEFTYAPNNITYNNLLQLPTVKQNLPLIHNSLPAFVAYSNDWSITRITSNQWVDNLVQRANDITLLICISWVERHHQSWKIICDLFPQLNTPQTLIVLILLACYQECSTLVAAWCSGYCAGLNQYCWISFSLSATVFR